MMRGRAGLGLMIWVAVMVVPTVAQDDALRDRVAQLIERLEAPKIEARDAAEKALINLGVRALPYLPEPGKASGTDREQRLERVRKTLREAQEPTSLKGSRVTLKADGVRLSEILKKLQAETGNPITDLRDQYGGDASNPSLDLAIEDLPFLKALDIVAEKAGATISYFTGDGSLGLMPKDQAMTSPADPKALLYEGAFRVLAQRVTTVRNLQAGSASCNVQIELGWEPQLRPMLLAVKAEEMVIEDDKGRPIKPQVQEESMSVVLRPENPTAELNVNMEAPPRDASTIARLKVKADVTVPAAMATFRFPSLDKKRETVRQGDVSVTLLGTAVDENNWLVSVEVDYQGGGAAFESYQQGLFNNRIFLRKGDGSVFDMNGGFNQIGGGDGKVAYEYIFVDAPGKPADYQLIYETPSKVITLPLEFEFRDIPLP